MLCLVPAQRIPLTFLCLQENDRAAVLALLETGELDLSGRYRVRCHL